MRNLPLPFELGDMATASETNQHNAELNSGLIESRSYEDIKEPGTAPFYKVYKRRWLGLMEMALLNLALGWTGTAFVALTVPLAHYFDVPIARINIVSSITAAAFVAPCPLVIWVINKYGPKASMNICAAVFLIGTWVIYGATRAHSYGGLIAGSVLSSVAQPFVLCAPTRYSKLWFPPRGRTMATAIPSLSYPLGAGVGALVGPPVFDKMGESRVSPWHYNHMLIELHRYIGSNAYHQRYRHSRMRGLTVRPQITAITAFGGRRYSPISTPTELEDSFP